MIELNEVSRKYNDFYALKNCSLKFSVGNIYIIKGKSGSGKSTLLNIISGLDDNYTGEMSINKENYKKMSKKRKTIYKKTLSYVMQKNLFYKNMSVLDNLKLVEKDTEVIKDLSKKFNVYKLLEQNPAKLSGGELQRVSLIRALLSNPQILILDEPTSNLDYNNSLTFVEYLKKIDKKDKIIIISTHKDIFDDLADSMIEIDYGEILNNQNNSNENFCDIKLNNVNSKGNVFNLILKNRFKENIIIKIFSILLIIFTLVCFSIFTNFKKEYLNKAVDEYPYNVLNLREMDIEAAEEKYKIDKVYKNYAYEENGNFYYPLLDYEDSIFKVKDVLFIGEYPTKDNEVLVNAQYVKENYGLNSYDEILDKKIDINNEVYKIRGVVGEDNVNIERLYSDVKFYEGIVKDGVPNSAVFIPYNKIKTIAEVIDDNIMVVFDLKCLPEIYDEKNLESSVLLNGSNFSSYENRLSQEIVKVKSPNKASIIVAVMLIIVSFFFIIIEVKMELFFRQREIGLLQLLHISKEDISAIFTLEYLLTYLINVIISLFMYFMIIVYIYKKYNYYLLLNLNYLLLILSGFILYSYFIISLSFLKYKNKNIINLIKR